ncbi:MAG: protein-glutamate methylesterase/protein-glutamine glutaminase [Bacillota bacterium]
MTAVTERLRALVVDDSAFMRKIISDLLAADPEIEVIGTARDGLEALDRIKRDKPSVVTMDVEMPRMDGLAALERIMTECPVPVVMVSSLTQDGAETTIRALSLGAVDFVGKPSGTISLDMAKVRQELIGKVKLANRVSLPSLRRSIHGHLRPRDKSWSALAGEPLRRSDDGPAPRSGSGPAGVPVDRLVVIGSSTGGPGALHTVVPDLIPARGTAFLIIQHMPAGFTKSLADRLNELSAVTVREAVDGEPLTGGVALLAPGGYHLAVTPDRAVALNQNPPQHGVRPSVDVTLESALGAFGDRCVGVILTGMGFDGAKGMAALKRAGGRTIVQDEASCVVYGMPRAVVEMGNADLIVPLEEVAVAVNQSVEQIPPPGRDEGGKRAVGS